MNTEKDGFWLLILAFVMMALIIGGMLDIVGNTYRFLAKEWPHILTGGAFALSFAGLYFSKKSFAQKVEAAEASFKEKYNELWLKFDRSTDQIKQFRVEFNSLEANTNERATNLSKLQKSVEEVIQTGKKLCTDVDWRLQQIEDRYSSPPSPAVAESQQTVHDAMDEVLGGDA